MSQFCNACPHLTKEHRPSIYPIGVGTDHICNHEQIGGRWIGFIDAVPEWCPLRKDEDRTVKVQKGLFG